MSLTSASALAWRLQRHFLDPIDRVSVTDVVDRLGAVPATPPSAADLAIRARRARSRPGDVDRALTSGELIKTFAFRGAAYLMTPETAGTYLALRAASRMWERPSWCSHYGLKPPDWPDLREAVRDALANGPLTADELGTAISALPRFSQLGPAFTDPSATFLKPFAWQGDISFGPSREGRATLQRLDRNLRWAGLPEIDVAGSRAVEAYFRAYGPATDDHLRYWLGTALGAGRKRVDGWLAAIDDRLAPVVVDGRSVRVLHDDVDELLRTPASGAVRLLPAHDPWVIAPGTADPWIVAPARRGLVSRGASLVIAGGVVSGTWSLTARSISVTWFAERGAPPYAALAAAAAGLGTILGADLPVSVASRV